MGVYSCGNQGLAMRSLLILISKFPIICITEIAGISDDEVINQRTFHELAVLFYAVGKLVVFIARLKCSARVVM